MSRHPHCPEDPSADRYRLPIARSVQRLHATKSLKAANKGLATKPLDPKKPPLAPVAYAKKRTPKSWTDQTTRA